MDVDRGRCSHPAGGGGLHLLAGRAECFDAGVVAMHGSGAGGEQRQVVREAAHIMQSSAGAQTEREKTTVAVLADTPQVCKTAGGLLLGGHNARLLQPAAHGGLLGGGGADPFQGGTHGSGWRSMALFCELSTPAGQRYLVQRVLSTTDVLVLLPSQALACWIVWPEKCVCANSSNEIRE